MIDTALVVPTIRENCISDFIDRWNEEGLFKNATLFIVEDNPEKTFDLSKKLNGICYCHFSWEDIEKELGSRSWIIPRRSDTIRSYGYYVAFKAGYKFTMTLDDDCYPESSSSYLVESHKRLLCKRNKWFNTLDTIKPRGIPYFNKGIREDVVLNHGLWTNVLDYDAPTQLANPQQEELNIDNRIVPYGSYFPMCGMNLMWKSEITVFMYHLLMGHILEVDPASPGGSVPTLSKLPFDRFGDIWCGIFMKKLVDMSGLVVSSGTPFIRHERASNPFKNLIKEANGLEVNEKLWEYVDAFEPEFPTRNLVLLYSRFAKYISKFDEFPEHTEYFNKLGLAMKVWADLIFEACEVFPSL
jgi:hypothetical protein